jgi:hypothetical protein
MAHFAELDSNNVVLRVIVVDNKDTSDAHGVEKEYIGTAFCERVLGGTWKQTSYNGNMRGKYAGIGYTYDAQLDEFVAPVVEAGTPIDYSAIASADLNAITSADLNFLTSQSL